MTLLTFWGKLPSTDLNISPSRYLLVFLAIFCFPIAFMLN